MRKSLTALCLAGLTALTPVSAAAEKLVFGTGNVVIHPINKLVMTPWAEKVNASANGSVDIAIRHGQMLVNSKNYVDRISDDVVQIAWGMLVFNPGLFPRSLVSTVPFIEGSAEATSMAFCKLYEDGVMDADFGNLKPLFFVPFPQSSIHINGGPLKSMSDIKGKKIMVGSPNQSVLVSAYGGTPLSISLPDQYQAMQRGTADGNMMTFTAFPAFNLDEVTTDHMKLPLGGAVGMVFMDKARFDGLSDEARATLEANSGCDVSREVGKVVDKWETDSIAIVEGKGGHTISDIDPAEFAEMKEKYSASINESFTGRVEGGEDILAKWIEAMAEANAIIAEGK